MELIQRSGILNKSATLDQIMALSMTLAGSGFGGSPQATWTFISPWYVYTGDQKSAALKSRAQK
jgi:hypothetical protein